MGISDSATALNKDILQSLFEAVRVAPGTKVEREQGTLILKQFEERASALTQEDKKLIGYSTPLDIKTWSGLFVPYMKHDLFHDNEKFLKQLKCPVLVIGGDKDLQDLPHQVKLIKEILVNNGNEQVTAKIYPRKNHLMQDATTGSPSEYGDIENTIAPDVINDIIHWLRTTTGSIPRIN
jgi:pimeloyl-ACP methyl ester carboxylesterase